MESYRLNGMKILINPTRGGQSLALKTTYYKQSLANFVHRGGGSMQANAVLLIERYEHND